MMMRALLHLVLFNVALLAAKRFTQSTASATDNYMADDLPYDLRDERLRGESLPIDACNCESLAFAQLRALQERNSLLLKEIRDFRASTDKNFREVKLTLADLRRHVDEVYDALSLEIRRGLASQTNALLVSVMLLAMALYAGPLCMRHLIALALLCGVSLIVQSSDLYNGLVKLVALLSGHA